MKKQKKTASRNFKLTIEYDGANFFGWQIQSRGQRNVQGEIQKALQKVFKSPVRVAGSGRTDRGVHARGQVANFKISTNMAPEQIQRAVNSFLPRDISIACCQCVPADFHAQFSARSKTYSYLIDQHPARPAIKRDHCLYYPYELDIDAMKKAAKKLIGWHDFKSFEAHDPKRRPGHNTTRKMSRISIKKKKSEVLITMEANGFLYKMARNIVGTLLLVGRGKLSPKDFLKILNAKNRSLAGDTAEPQGLCLEEVKYSA